MGYIDPFLASVASGLGVIRTPLQTDHDMLLRAKGYAPLYTLKADVQAAPLIPASRAVRYSGGLSVGVGNVALLLLLLLFLLLLLRGQAHALAAARTREAAVKWLRPHAHCGVMGPINRARPRAEVVDFGDTDALVFHEEVLK
jgi:hypothetical protein